MVDDTKPFEVSYRLDKTDYRAMMDAYWRLTTFRRVRVLVLQAIPVAAALFAIFVWWTTGKLAALGLAALAAAGFAVAPLINVLAYDRSFKRLGIGEGEVRLRADAAGLELHATTLGDSNIPWTAVRHVSDTGGRVLLWLNVYQAVIVPRRAFGSGTEAERFVQLARGRTAGQHL